MMVHTKALARDLPARDETVAQHPASVDEADIGKIQEGQTVTFTEIAALAVAALWPALFRASMRFRLANTSWRGMRFHFTGDMAGAYKTMLPVLIPGVLIAVLILAPETVAAMRAAAASEISSFPSRAFLTVSL